MKFKFTTDFQYDLLRYTVQDKNGYKALELYDDSYFTLTEHSIIAHTIKKFYKRKKTIPGSVILIEEINKIFNHRDYVNNLTDEDRKEILLLCEGLYKGVVKDGDEILNNTEKFAQYVDLKNEIENVDLLDYEQYDQFSKKIQKAISPRIKSIDERGSFLVKDVKYRQAKRKDKSSIIPLPWKGLNRLTNANGYAKNSILVILDEAKKFKTGALVNIARRYMQIFKKNVLVIDLDNGEDEIMLRVEQSIAKATKLEILDEDGDADKKVQYAIKKSRRQGGEIIVERFPSLITTAANIGNHIDYLYREFGFRTEILIIDYISKMGCISGKDSLHERIGDAYIDISNLALEKDLDLVFTAQHVTRDAVKSRGKRVYESTDVAGSIDITRHVQAIYGLNRTIEEELDGYQRVEIVAQRDGPPRGHVVFNIDIQKQRLNQIVDKDKLEKYYQKHGNHEEESSNGYEGGKSTKQSRGGDLNVQ